MALPSPVAGDIVASAHIRSIKDHLEGTAGSTAPWAFRQSSGNFIVTLSTADGSTKVSIRDSGGVEVFAVDSDGNITFSGSLTLSTLTIPTAASPAQTAEGSTVWDSDDDNLTIGDGTSRRRFDADNKGSDIASAATLNLTNDKAYHITGTTTVTAISTKPSGFVVYLTFDSTVLLTHNATSLILRADTSRTTVAGETVVFQSEGSGNWREIAPEQDSLLTLLENQAEDGVYRGWWAASNVRLVSTGEMVGVGVRFVENNVGTADTASTGAMTQLVTGTTTNDEAGLLGSNIPTGKDFTWLCQLFCASSASQTILGGATPTTANFADANNIIAWRVSATGNYIGVSDSGGTETTRDTSVVPDGATVQRLKIVRNGSTVQFFRNGSQVGADVTTNIPAADLNAGVGIRTGTTAARTLNVCDFQGMVEV